VEKPDEREKEKKNKGAGRRGRTNRRREVILDPVRPDGSTTRFSVVI
jgi:hypothetical protein